MEYRPLVITRAGQFDRRRYDGWMTFELFGDSFYARDPRAAAEQRHVQVARISMSVRAAAAALGIVAR
ncbi:hypothetical protein RJT17_35660 [Streptomyces sp. P5-A9]|uniref:hypothetical protein n=1 Tax=Streptomyces sp. P5-A9 TaxID=3071730 RepID=UPI002FCC5A06